MKKLAVLMFILCMFKVQAQQQWVSTFHGIGVSGISKSRLGSDLYNRFGYAGGVSYQVHYGKIDYGIEVGYSQRGFTRHETYVDSVYRRFSADRVVHHDYITLPLSVSWRADKRFFGLVGAALVPAFLLRSTTYFDGELVPEASKPLKLNIGGQVEFGGGFRVNKAFSILSKLTLFHSFTKMSNETYFGSKYRSRGYCLGIGLEYNFE